MNETQLNVLVIGFGNPGRLDDGLGPAFAKAVESWHIPGITVDTTYQLSIEDSVEIARHDLVIFADATVHETDTFYFRKLDPGAQFSHTTHHLTPASALGLAHNLFDTNCCGFELGIRGYAFNDFGEQLSAGASKNLQAALAFLKQLLIEGFRLNLPQIEPYQHISPK